MADSCGAPTQANQLFTELTQGVDFSTPNVNLDDSSLGLPSETDNPLYTAVSSLKIEDLTTGVVDGTGAFDVLMKSVGAHLKAQHTAGRVTSADYATTYQALTASAMGTALQFLLGKDQAYWAAMQTQAAAKIAEAQLIRERAEVLTAKVRLAIAQAEMQTTRVNFAKTKMELSILDAQYCISLAQKRNAGLEGDILNHRVTSMLPVELQILQADQVIKNYQGSTMLPAEKAVVDAQRDDLIKKTELANFELTQLQPIVKDLRSGELTRINFENTAMMPAQKALLDAQLHDLTESTRAKTFEVDNLLPKQETKLDKDIILTTNQGNEVEFSVSRILPAQEGLLKEQREVQRAQTADNRSEGQAVGGLVLAQRNLYQQQIESYKRDAEVKAAKLFLDAWITNAGISNVASLPTQASSNSLGLLLANIKSKNNI